MKAFILNPPRHDERRRDVEAVGMMSDGEFLKADYLTQLRVLHEWNEIKAVMKRYDLPDAEELNKALKQSQIRARLMTKLTVGWK